jgi:hypothetical protein
MRKVIVNTRATASQLHLNLMNLYSYMATIDSNIEIFNQRVKINQKTADDLIINLFKAYLMVSDGAFVRYTTNKKDRFDDGEDFTVEGLLTMSLIKFQTLKDSGKLNSLSPEQEQIAALNYEVTSLKDRNLKLTKDTKGGNKNKPGDKPKVPPKSKKPTKKAVDEENWAWKKVPPKEGGGIPSRCQGLTNNIPGVKITIPRPCTLH